MEFDDEVRRINEKKFEEMLKLRTSQEGGSKAPTDLTDENFDVAIKTYPIVVVDFWAPWCGPCKIVSPVLDQLALEMTGKATFVKLNVDDNPRTAQQFGIQGIPTILIFKDGKPVDGIVG